MKGYFLKPGKYKNGIETLVIENSDVKSKKMYEVNDKNAQSFYNAGKFVYEGHKPKELPKEEPKKKPEPKKEVKVEKKSK